MTDALIVIGGGSYSTTITELAESCGFKVTAYLEDDVGKIGTIIDGLPVRGPVLSALTELPTSTSVAVAIGNNDARLAWIHKARSLGLATPPLISPRSLVSPKATISEAVYLHPGSHVWTHATLGLGTILSPNATVAHHTALEDGCFVSTGANVGASITVEDCSFFGIGSTTSTGVGRIATHTLVGAGAVVIRDTHAFGVYAGCPATLIRRQHPCGS